MKLADWLKLQRKTHDAFAVEIGVDLSSVTRYANGDRTPKPEIMRRIKQATAGYVTADDFMAQPESAGTVNARTARELPTRT